MAALTKSPAGPGARRSSSGSDKLRPVLPFGLDDVDFGGVDDEEGDVGTVPREGTGSFPSGGGVDEVEYAYGLVHTFFCFDRSFVLTYRLSRTACKWDVQTKPHSLVS